MLLGEEDACGNDWVLGREEGDGGRGEMEGGREGEEWMKRRGGEGGREGRRERGRGGVFRGALVLSGSSLGQ